MSDKEKRVTAYHEAGHALAAWAMPNLDPVHKVTILPRGRSLGHTLVLPVEDRYTQTRSEILDQLVYALGGRAAEELVFHEPTTGASNDIEKATALARSMVTEYGMSSKLGAVKYGTNDSEPFLGRDYGHQRDYSEDIAADIDAEVRNLIEGAHDEAWEILVQYRDVLDAMVLELAEKETLAKEDLERILAPGPQAPAAQLVLGLRQAHPVATGRRSRSRRRSGVRRPTASTANGSNGAHGVNGGPTAPTVPAGTSRRRPARARPARRPPTGRTGYGAAGLRSAARVRRSRPTASRSGRPVRSAGLRRQRPVRHAARLRHAAQPVRTVQPAGCGRRLLDAPVQPADRPGRHRRIGDRLELPATARPSRLPGAVTARSGRRRAGRLVTDTAADGRHRPRPG